VQATKTFAIIALELAGTVEKAPVFNLFIPELKFSHFCSSPGTNLYYFDLKYH